MLLTKRNDVTSIRFQSVNTAYYNLSIPKTCHETLNSTYVQVLDLPLWKFENFYKHFIKKFNRENAEFSSLAANFFLEYLFQVRDIYLIRAHNIRFISATKSVELNNSRSIEDVVLPELKIFHVFSWNFSLCIMIFLIRGGYEYGVVIMKEKMIRRVDRKHHNY